VRPAIFGNVGCVAAFRVGHHDARILDPEFSGAVAADLMELNRGQCLVRMGTHWTLTRTLPPPRIPEPDPTERVNAATRARREEMVGTTQTPPVLAVEERLNDGDYVN
jgi:hypothetical protein